MTGKRGVWLLILSIVPFVSNAGENEADLAKKLNNPIAALISVPMQLNYDQDIGAADKGKRWVLNIQPVIPFTLNEDWNMISRTIVPLISQDDVVPGTHQSGLGDVVQSFFFSPKAPTENGWTWGAGPVLLLPIDTSASTRPAQRPGAVGPKSFFM
jgi:hypothetical protein